MSNNDSRGVEKKSLFITENQLLLTVAGMAGADGIGWGQFTQPLETVDKMEILAAKFRIVEAMNLRHQQCREPLKKAAFDACTF